MRKMIGEVGRKLLKKRWIIPHFHDVTWMIFDTILTKFGLCQLEIGRIILTMAMTTLSFSHEKSLSSVGGLWKSCWSHFGKILLSRQNYVWKLLSFPLQNYYSMFIIICFSVCVKIQTKRPGI